MKMKRVEFDSVALSLVGNLYLPEDFDEAKQYKTIVVTPPAHQIKEQTAAQYAPKFTEQGFVFFAFDYNSKGESQSYKEGFSNDENNFRKQEDLRNAVSYLSSLSFVDKERLFGLGICGGGNVMSAVMITDLRLKAFASISAMLATDAMFFADQQAFVQMVNGANDARQSMYESNQPLTVDLFGYDDPDYLEQHKGSSSAELEGYDYYGTDRAGSATYPRFSNKVLANIYDSVTLNIGEQYADRMIQPFLGVVGEKAETAICTKLFYDKVSSEKEYFVVPGASHIDLYDRNEYVTIAANKIADFYSNI
ncbi:MAG: alpha/beta hydrolase [Cellvibrionaceae bacterium]|nr:alpha/beta hydrolase [Cellvibrionaceae bacterium]